MTNLPGILDLMDAYGIPRGPVTAPTLASEAEPRDDGLTAEEGIVMDALIDAVNAFGKLKRQHPDEGRDFCDGIHRCQDTLALRVCRRAFPKGWPDKGPAAIPTEPSESTR